MRRGAWACFEAKFTGALLALCLAVPSALAQAPVPLAEHLQQASFLVVPGGTYDGLPALRQPPAGEWKEVPLPHVLPRGGVAAGDAQSIDTAWFRLDVPATLAAVPPGQLRLYLPRWQTIGQVAVYVDDRLAYRSGAGPVWNGFNHPLWIALDQPGAPRPKTVWLRVDHLRAAGAAVSTAWLGDERALADRRWWRSWLQTTLPRLASSGFLIVGLFALAVWARRREPAYGLFAVAAALFFVRSLHYHLGLEPLPISEEWFGWMTVNSLAWLIPVTYFLGLRLHGQRYPRVEWTLVAMIALSTVASLPPVAVLPHLALLAPAAYLLMILGLVGITVLGSWAAARARSRDGMLVATANVISIPAAVHDLLLQNYQVDIEHFYVLPYTSIILLGSFLFVLRRRYLGALAERERAQAVLEERLREREAELKASHEKLRAIERDQVLAHERERLMQDMHDGLGSSLMGALKAVEHGQQQDLAQVLRECIEDLKLAIDSLEPVQADLLLLATLRFRLGTRLQQAGVTMQWDVQDVPPLPWLDPRSALHILRILQEIIGNAVRHSGTAEVKVSTSHDDEFVTVTVTDSGRGFDSAATGGRGRGLANVRRRAAAIGAEAAWTPVSPGTRFELRLPRAQPQPAGDPVAA